MKRKILSLFLFLILLAFLFLVAPARAAGYVVSNTADSGPGSLRQAILDAEAAPGADTITFSVSGTITLASTLPTITDPAGLTIDGAGQTVVISGNDAVRVMAVASGATLMLNEVTIRDGFAIPEGGGVYNAGTLDIYNSTFVDNYVVGPVGYDGGGGGIFNQGTMTVSNSIFSGNRAEEVLSGGGGILNRGLATVSNSTFSGNGDIAYDRGGGISNDAGTMIVSNSTFSANAGTYGGGIYNYAGTMTVSNSTFSGNSAAYGGGIYNRATMTVSNSTFSRSFGDSEGGGIWNYGTLTLKNSIVANSTSGGNCSALTAITDGGGNLSYPDTTCPGANLDPQLGPLQDNGGPTETMALLPGSPAVDAAVDCPPPATDQRGVARPQGAACDSGAFELEKVNQAPDCTNVTGSVTSLWPPNHKFHIVNLSGATDPDGDSLTMSISGIFQDEAVDAPGSGNTAPDGQIVDGDTVQVRAERVGGGNGRVYHIQFLVEDGYGGTCAGEALVGVPPSKKATAVDDGPLYDSTQP